MTEQRLKPSIQTTRRDELHVLPPEKGMKRADELLRAMLNSSPDRQTLKPKPLAKRPE